MSSPNRRRVRLSDDDIREINLRLRSRLDRHRIRLDWEPSWSPEISGYAANQIPKFRRSIDPIHSFEDLMQDAYLAFLKVEFTYPRVDNSAHFMALFKVTWRNFLCDYARYNSRRIDYIDDYIEDPMLIAENLVGNLDSDGYLAALAFQSSPEVYALLSMLYTDEGLEIWREPYKDPDTGLRQTLNERFCAIIGIDPNSLKRKNLVQQLKDMLT